MRKKILSASAVLFAAAASASAQMVYEPFDYGSASIGTNLSNTTGTPSFAGYINGMNGQQWVDRATSLAGENTIVSGSLSSTGTGIPPAIGNSVNIANKAKISAISIAPTGISTGTVYYSMLVNMGNLAGFSTGTGGVFFAALNNSAGATSTGNPTNFYSRLAVRRDIANTNNVDFGIASDSTTTSQWVTGPGGTGYDPTIPIFLVASYTHGGSGTDPNSLWVSPTASLGFGTAPAPDATVNQTTSGTIAIQSLMLRQNSGDPTAGIQVDEVRVDTTWAQATAPAGSTFTGTSGSNWSSSGSWDAGGVPNAAQSFANFTGAGGTVNLDAGQTVSTLTFRSATPYVVSTTNGSTLALNAGAGGISAINMQPTMDATSGAVITNSGTISTPISLANSLNVHVGTGQTLTMSGAISGTGITLTKDDPGLFALQGANSFTGTVIVNEGTLIINSDSALGAPLGSETTTLFVNKGTGASAVLRFNQSTTLSSLRDIQISGTPSFNVDIGKVATIPGKIFAATGGSNLSKNGSGTLVLTGDNSTNAGGGFINAVTVVAGTLNVSNDVNLGQAAKTVQVDSTATLQFGASFTLSNRTFNFTGGSSTATIDTNGFNMTIPGTLIGAATTIFAKAGVGTLTVNNTANTYPGPTRVNGGLLEFTAATTEGNTASITANAGGAVGLDTSSLDPLFIAKINASATASVGGLALSSFDIAAVAPVNFTSALLSGAGTQGMSVGAIGSQVYTGTITPFNSTVGYRLGGGGTLTLPNNLALTGTNPVTITNGGTVVLTGTNDYVGTTTVDALTTLSVGADANLGNSANPIAFTGGTLSATGTLNSAGRALTVATAAGGTIKPNGNLLTFSNVSATTGTLAIAPSGLSTGSTNAVRVGTVSAATGGKLDLTDNKLITSSPVGTFVSGAYTDISGLIASGRNNGAWNGSGIVTSQSVAKGSSALTTLAVASAADVKGITGTQTATFGGQVVSPSDTLVMYTYAGDANLNGAINGDDYFRIDQGFAAHATGYANGDFNYDGRIDADDYFIIDKNYSEQSAGFTPAAPLDLGGLSAVPEPASLAMLGIGALATLRRRRRAN